MLIVLDKTESIEMAEGYLAESFEGPPLPKEIFWQTDLDHEDMKYKIDVYVR